jgi:hypothetical protein
VRKVVDLPNTPQRSLKKKQMPSSYGCSAKTASDTKILPLREGISQINYQNGQKLMKSSPAFIENPKSGSNPSF